jgi:hypothetical protein
MIMGIIVWEGIPRRKADEAYEVLKDKLPKYGISMEVRFCIIVGIKLSF